VHVSGIFDLYNLANKRSDEGEYGVTDSFRIGPVQISEVTGPDPVHLRPDRAFTTGE